MRKILMFLLCLALIGGAAASGADEPPADDEQRVSEMGYRKFVILGEGVNLKTAFQYGNSYRAVVWYKEAVNEGIPEPSPARKELISELQGINATGEKWEFIIPGMGEEYFLVTLRNMDNDTLSKATGSVYLPDSSSNKSMEDEVQRVSGGSFVVECGR